MNRPIWGLSPYESEQAYISIQEFLEPGEETQSVSICLSLEWGYAGFGGSEDIHCVISYRPYLLTISNFGFKIFEYSMRKDDGSLPAFLDITKSLTKKGVSSLKSIRSMKGLVNYFPDMLKDSLSEDLKLKMRFTGFQARAHGEIIGFSKHLVSPGLLVYARGPDPVDGYPYHAHLAAAIQTSQSLYGLTLDLSSGPQEHISGDPIIFETLEHLANIQEKNRQQIICDTREVSATHRDQSDPFEKLERLADLHSKGIITQEDFDNKKAQILGEM